MTDTRVQRWERRLDVPLTISTIAFLAAYAWPILDPGLSSGWKDGCTAIVWITWALLGFDFVARLVLSRSRWAFLRRNPVDILTLVFPLLRPLRLLRLVTLLSALNRHAGNSLRGRVGLYLVGSVSLIAFVASLAVLDTERGGDGSIQTFGDALWWSMTTITTVGYGDTFPVTTTGRCIAVALMLAGIAVLGVVTASFASWLVERVTDAGEKADAATRNDINDLRLEIERLRSAIELSGSDRPSGTATKPL